MKQRINYYTTNISTMVRSMVDELAKGNTECIENRDWPQDEVFKSMGEFFSKYSLKDPVKNQQALDLLHRVDPNLGIDIPENTCIFDELWGMMMAD